MSPGLDVAQFRRYVLAPTLAQLAHLEPRLDGPVARELVLGTFLHESRVLRFLRQLPNGPARGLLQMEPPTHRWMREWLAARPAWRHAFDELLAPWPPPDEQLYTNLAYMVAACRWRYWVVRAPLPDSPDAVDEMARYWDRHYQTVPDEIEPRRWAATYREFGATSLGETTAR